MRIRTRSREWIENNAMLAPSAVICMADSPQQLAVIKDQANVVARLDLIFHDAGEAFQIVSPPTAEHGRAIYQFAQAHLLAGVEDLVLQCEVGIGRSQGALAALMQIYGQDAKPVLAKGTYNRRLYRSVLAAAGISPPVEPLASIAVRVKYSPERLLLFLLCLRRQRYENWEVVAVTDGPNPAAVEVARSLNDPRIRLIETEKPLGRWGHPYRQIGLDACGGEFIGMSNDDNYYTPGYLEQMIVAMENADLAVCRLLHSYVGWGVAAEGTDIGAWIARAALIRQTPWNGLEFTSDRQYLARLKALAKDRIVEIKRPLFVHN
jgi:hypothetical protein